MYKFCSYFSVLNSFKPLLVRFPLASAYGVRTKSNQYGGLIKSYSRTYRPTNNFNNSTNKNNNNNNHNNNNNNNNNNYTRTGTMMSFTITGLLLQFLGLEEENQDSELVEVIKRAELTYRAKDYEKAEQLLHVGLKVAQDLRNEKAKTYIYDRMANVALDAGHHVRARKLFTAVLARLFEEGIKEDDLIVIHISYKLIKIMEALHQYKAAMSGYSFCFQRLKKRLTENNENEQYRDSLLLYGIVLNSYAYFLYELGQLDKAFTKFKKAYNICVELYGKKHEQTVLILNNLGTICKHKGNIEEAFLYFKEAAEIGKELADMKELSIIYLNLAYIYMDKQMLVDAKTFCEKAVRNALRHEYHIGLKEADNCLEELKEIKTNR